MSATPLYLAELKNVFADPLLKKEYCFKCLEKSKTISVESQFKVKYKYMRSLDGNDHHYWTSRIHNVFGNLMIPYTSGIVGSVSQFKHLIKYEPSAISRVMWMGGSQKGGIEILNAQPNATGRTYSNKCSITVKELKEACKKNGIKSTKMDKKEMLHALMKC
jgi:hypothetical protein